jgi:uncharacterized membrane protein
MFGLTTLGIVHTLVSLAAIVFGVRALARHHEISPREPLGRGYLLLTLIAAATALGIFRHGSFGPPHGLAILTLLALAVGTLAALTGLFGSWSRYVQAIAYTATFLFHMIPGFTESLTRLPPGQPLLPGPDAPAFVPIYGVLLLVFIVGLTLQLRWVRRTQAG